MKKRFPYIATIFYIIFIVLINSLFVILPKYRLFGSLVSPADMVVGFIYLFRDFAQREIKHYIFLAMFIAAVLSYLLADKAIAIASVSAFVVGEIIDWMIFTFTKKPLSKRLVWSALASSPFDTLVFLSLIHRLNIVAFLLMTLGKLLGVLLLWGSWRIRQNFRISKGNQIIASQ